jgi:hypothetical protein
MDKTLDKAPLLIDDGIIDIPHLGITLRVLIGAALEDTQEFKKKYRLRYKHVIIGELRIKTGMREEYQNRKKPLGGYL